MDTLTRKWHGVPVWALALTGLAVAWFGYHYFRIHSANAANNAAGQVQSDLLRAPQNGGGGAGSLTIPADPSQVTTTIGNADTPPFTSPSPAAVNSPAQSSAVTPLDSAPVTDTAPSFADSIPTTDNSSPQSYAYQVTGGVTNGSLPPDQQVPGLPDNALVITSHMGSPSPIQTPQQVLGLDQKVLPTPITRTGRLIAT